MRRLYKRLKSPTKTGWRQVVKLVRYMKGSRRMATFFPAEGQATPIAAYADGDWACDDMDRKSVSGGWITVAGCRAHSHNRGTSEHALSSGECEIMSMSDRIKDCWISQDNLEMSGLGKLPIMKHLDVRRMWLRETREKGAFSVKKISREVNIGDMLRHAPSAADLQKFLITDGRDLPVGV